MIQNQLTVSTAYKLAAIAVNLILEPFRPPVVATDAPAYLETSLLPVAATNCLPATDASIPTVLKQICQLC